MTRPRTHGQLLDLAALVPRDRPFGNAEAVDLGLGVSQRRSLLAGGVLKRRVPGVYHHGDLADSIELRWQCLSLVVPRDCVVVDRTAAWVWVGDRALAPGDHLELPRLSIFAPPGRRLRNGLTDSGERHLLARDVVDVGGGLLVTTPLRTACDQGRLLHLDQAFAAMDGMASTGSFGTDDLVAELARFKGYRGVVQAREWAPYVDGGSESQFESIGRRNWISAGLPVPRTQCPVPAPDGGRLRVDYGLEDERFGSEYLGEEFHGEEQQAHDSARLTWLRERQRWVIVEARKHNVVGHHRDLEMVYRLEWARFRASRPTIVS